MTFGEKVRAARITLGLSQSELAQMTDISERSLYTYEQLGTIPRSYNVKRLAEALNVSAAYLLDDDETDTTKSLQEEEFLRDVRKEYGSKGAREAHDVLQRAGALFAGGDLDEDAKDVFFQALMQVYLDSKANAREQFSPGRRVGRNRSSKDTNEE